MDLRAYKNEVKGLNEKLEKHGKQLLADEFKSFFENNPKVEKVRWTQYTPHFNDGDECTFSRHEFQLSGDFDEHFVSGAATDEDGFYDSWDLKKGTQLGTALKNLKDTFDNNTDDVFLTAFGDGVRVTATRRGFKVDDYDHD